MKCILIHTGKVNLYNQTFHKTFFKMCDICGGIKYEVYIQNKAGQFLGRNLKHYLNLFQVL